MLRYACGGRPIRAGVGLWLAATALLAILALVGCGGSPDDDRSTPRLFAADSFWNAPLAADAPIDAGSDDRVAELVRQVQKFGGWINTDQFSTPLYIVSPDQPEQDVALPRDCCEYIRDQFRGTPLPSEPMPAEGTDAHLTVWRPATDELWEFWQMSEAPGGGWQANYGGRINGVSTSDGVLALGGASATSLPVIGGTILIDEAQAGVIPHALAMAIPRPQKGRYVAPARRTDGDGAPGVPGTSQIPEGARFRLPADLDIDGQNWSAFTKMLARAARDHGIVLRDKAGAVVFFGEDHRGAGPDPWAELFAGETRNQIMDEFPWAELQLLEMGPIRVRPRDRHRLRRPPPPTDDTA